MNTQYSLPPIIQTISSLGLVQHDKLVGIYQSHKNSKDIINAIVDKRLVPEQTISAALSERFGIPLFDLSVFNPDYFVTRLIHKKIIEQHWVLPIYQHGNTLFVAILDPTNNTALDEIKFSCGLDVSPVLVELSALKHAIQLFLNTHDNTLIDQIKDDDYPTIEDNFDDNSVDPNEEPVIQYVNKILSDAINREASDIHIEPFEKHLRIRYRIDGILHAITQQPIKLASRITARIKIIAKLDIAEHRVPQDGRVKLTLSQNKAIDFRVSTLPTVYGEKVVMRLLDSDTAMLDLNTLGFTDTQLSNYKQAISSPYGMILITGPTGSGKTVSMYSALNTLNKETKNISTVEDPVEIQIEGINQVQINEKANLSFANTLRAFLRQDPDIIMLGEIRDLETAEIAIKASQTGHLVLSTLHTNDAPATLTRLLNMGIPAFNIASAVLLIVAQRLIRKLCEDCKIASKLPLSVLEDYGLNTTNKVIYEANKEGCTKCLNGYKGRSAIFQVLNISDEIKELILQGCTEQDIERAAATEGVADLRASGLLNVIQGITSIEEIERVTNA